MTAGVLIGHVAGWSLVFFVAWMMIITVAHIKRDLGLLSPRGFSWFLAILVGNLLGVVLYKFFRLPVERACEALLERR